MLPNPFLALEFYYRRFIKKFAKIADTLTENTSEKIELEWTEYMPCAFDELKESLCTTIVLVYPNHEKPFIVSTDASSKAVGAVLSQLEYEGHEHTIHYASRSFNKPEKHYSAFEGEALGIVFTLQTLRQYPLYQRLNLYTDPQALKYVINLRDTHERIARWMSLFVKLYL